MCGAGATKTTARRRRPLSSNAQALLTFGEEKKDDVGAVQQRCGDERSHEETGPFLSSPTAGIDCTLERSVTFLASPFGTAREEGSLGLLALCAVGVCSCYLAYGVLQERVMSCDSVSGAGPASTFLVLNQTVTNAMVACAWQWVNTQLKVIRRKERGGAVAGENGCWVARLGELNHILLLLTAFCYFAAMACSNEAFRWVSYPTAVLAKSSKLVPTMVVGSIVEQRSYSLREWAGVALITSGIVAFNWSRMVESGSAMGDGKRDSLYGLVLLFLSLAMDGLLASFQGILKREDRGPGKFRGGREGARCRPPSAIETMLFVNLYACLFLLPVSVYTGQFANGVKLLRGDAGDGGETARWIGLLNLTAAGGQVFIFLTIYFFSPLMCTTITTTRKFFTILLSVKQFGHVFSVVQWTSIMMVFMGLYMEITVKLRKGGLSSGTKDVEEKFV